jgi:hypothetical protein
MFGSPCKFHPHIEPSSLRDKRSDSGPDCSFSSSAEVKNEKSFTFIYPYNFKEERFNYNYTYIFTKIARMLKD